MSMNELLALPLPRIAVPTATVIGICPDDEHRVWVIQHQDTKHAGRLTLVGGRLEPNQTFLDCILAEWEQEVGGKGATIFDINEWSTKTDPYSDVRVSTFGKLTHNRCDEAHCGIKVIGLYGLPDKIFTAKVRGTPFPKDGEAKQCLLVDLREMALAPTLEESAFGAAHDVILYAYKMSLSGRPIIDADFTDLTKLRASLRNWSNDEEIGPHGIRV